jgi:hypothetical protein
MTVIGFPPHRILLFIPPIICSPPSRFNLDVGSDDGAAVEEVEGIA